MNLILFLYFRAPLLAHRRIVISRFFSDDEKPPKKQEKNEKVPKKYKNEDSMKKLNSLLENMTVTSEKPDVKVLKAVPKEKKPKQEFKPMLSEEEIAK
jgi:hypothetical protein